MSKTFLKLETIEQKRSEKFTLTSPISETNCLAKSSNRCHHLAFFRKFL